MKKSFSNKRPLILRNFLLVIIVLSLVVLTATFLISFSFMQNKATSTDRAESSIVIKPATFPKLPVHDLVYDSKLVTFTYPSSWFVWKEARHGAVDGHELHTIPLEQENDRGKNYASIIYRVMPTMYSIQDVNSKKSLIEKLAATDNESHSSPYGYSRVKIDGFPALRSIQIIPESIAYVKQYEIFINDANLSFFYIVFGENDSERDALRQITEPDFDNLVNSLEIKNFDPTLIDEYINKQY